MVMVPIARMTGIAPQHLSAAQCMNMRSRRIRTPSAIARWRPAVAGQVSGSAESGLILTPRKTGTEKHNGVLIVREVVQLQRQQSFNKPGLQGAFARVRVLLLDS
jgi:hypothetical protein